jgi:limonene-1,2-epoxide hydrolase
VRRGRHADRQFASLNRCPNQGHDPAAPPAVDFDGRHAHIRRVTRPSEVAESFVAAISRHDPDAVAVCFAEDYEDEAPARRGEVVRGRDEVRANFVRMFTSMPDVNAAIIRLADRENEVWMEWRLSGTRDDGTLMDFIGVNIFGVADGVFGWGRIYTELARSLGGIEAQLARMTGDEAPT